MADEGKARRHQAPAVTAGAVTVLLAVACTNDATTSAATAGSGGATSSASGGGPGSGGAGALGQGGGGGRGDGGAEPCVAPLADCNGDPSDGCETDVTQASAHCGSCGHDCEQGGCVDATCQPYMLSPAFYPSSIAVDATSLYWTSLAGGTCEALPLSGGQAVTLVDSIGEAAWVAESGPLVYVHKAGDDDVIAVPKAGGAWTSVAPVGHGPRPLALDGDWVYRGGAADVTRMSVTSDAEELIAAEGPIYAVAIAGTDVLWGLEDGTIRRAPKNGGAATTITVGATWPNDMTADATHVYWAAGAGVYRAPLAGGDPEALHVGAANATVIAVDGARVYWGTSEGDVFGRDLGGGPPELLSSSPGWLVDLVVTADAVYWAQGLQDGAIFKLVK